MDRHEFGAICKSRKLAWGTWITEFMTPHTIRTMARAGFDWLWLDNEHFQRTYETIQEVIHTSDQVGIISLLRVTQLDYALIAGALDMGVHGIIVPRVETAGQVREIVDCAKYPPVGKRGFGLRTTIFPHDRVTMTERIEDQNDHRFLIIQVESVRGVENIEAMLDEADGQIDAVFFGPDDFQMDIGKPDTPDAPELDAATRRIGEVCKERGISAGAPANTIDDTRLWIDRGFNLICYRSDHFFMAGAASRSIRQLRELEQG